MLLTILTVQGQSENDSLVPEEEPESLYPSGISTEEATREALSSLETSEWCGCETVRVPFSMVRNSLYYYEQWKDDQTYIDFLEKDRDRWSDAATERLSEWKEAESQRLEEAQAKETWRAIAVGASAYVLVDITIRILGGIQ